MITLEIVGTRLTLLVVQYLRFALTIYDIAPFPIRYLECQWYHDPSPIVNIE